MRDKLTERQQQVLHLMIKGFTGPQIGAALDITEKCVKFHKGNIFRTLGISSTRAIRAAYSKS